VARIGAALVGLWLVVNVGMRNHQPGLGTVVYGAIIGLLYAVVAFGLILVYRATRIINFAQAEIGAAAAVFATLLIKLHGVPYLLAVPIALLAGGVTGLLVEVLVIRRFAKAPRLVLSVATIGVALILTVVQLYLPHWLGQKKALDPSPPRTPFTRFRFEIGSTVLNANAIVIIFAVAAVVIALTLFFKASDYGVAIRASAENAERALLLGISVKRLSSVVWILSAVLSTVGVFLRIPVVGLPIGADIGPSVLLYALTAAVVARMESFATALVTAVFLGIAEQTLYYFSSDPNISIALTLPIILGALLLQRERLSRGKDAGLATWKQSSEFRPIPPELRRLPEVQWARAVGAIAVAGAAIALPFVVPLQQQILAAVILIYAMVAVSLVILTGWAGQISLGQWGLAGVGALVAGGMASHLEADFFVTIVAAGLAGAVASLVIGLPALRIQGLYLAVSTLAFGLAVQVWLLSPLYFSRFLPSQLRPIRRPQLYGRWSLDGPRPMYFVCLVALGLCLLSARAVRGSRTGRVMIAARENERGAASYGVSVARARVAAFAISGFWAAVAGALFAYHQRAIDTAAFTYETSLLILTIVVIGGVTSLPGALLGALWIGVLKYGGLSPALQLLGSGAGALILLLALPGGLAQALYTTRDNLLRSVAERRGIVVPSLLADVRVEDDGAAETEAEPAIPRRLGSFGSVTEGPPQLRTAVLCPACGERVLLSQVPEHPHFEVVPA
jgi:branched-chain amino acid transport system permease protein